MAPPHACFHTGVCIYFPFTIMSSDSNGYTFNSPTKIEIKLYFSLTIQGGMLQITQEPTRVTLCMIFYIN